MQSLLSGQIAQFIDQGFIKIENAFSKEIADECRAILWNATGCNPSDPTSWTEPVIRIGELTNPPFIEAGNTPRLLKAFYQLAGDNWIKKESMGSFPIRFPVKKEAIDTGWHVDAGFPGEHIQDYFQWRINIKSRGRALLMLFLFSDVTDADAPTLIKIGSHKDVSRLLMPYGDSGRSFSELADKLSDLPSRPIASATGSAGTVYLCHPFLIHSAQNHAGLHPKFMAQPALLSKKDFNIDPKIGEHCPIEQAILQGIIS